MPAKQGTITTDTIARVGEDVRQARPPVPPAAKPPVVDSLAPGVLPLADVLEIVRRPFRITRNPMDVEHEIRTLRTALVTLAEHTIAALQRLEQERK
jgi:hypothetical protein